MKIDTKKIYFSKIILAIIVLLVLLNIIEIEIKNNSIDILVLITFALIGIYSIFQIYKDKIPFTLNKTFWYFNLIFFCIAPLIQYLSDYEEWGFQISNNDYFKSNLFILVSMLIFNIVYKGRKKIKSVENFKIKEINLKNIHIMLLYMISFVCFVLMILNVGFSNLLSRETNTATLSDNNMFNTIYVHVMKCIPVFAFTLIYYNKKKIDLGQIILLLMILLLNFPTSTTRFWMGAIFIGIFLILFCQKNMKNRLYDMLIIIIFVIAFPILYEFKFHDINYFIENGIEVTSIAESYNSVDYDAYSIIPRIFDYVKDNDIVYGQQVIGTILFMVPRGIWAAKPYPTGIVLATEQGQTYTNISCPYISEGYINFGFLGMLIFQVFLAYLCKKMDYLYWSTNDRNKYVQVIYPYLMGFLIFLLRGSLHPVVVYFFCFCIPIIFVFGINLVNNIHKKISGGKINDIYK